MNILIVDDSEADCYLIKKILLKAFSTELITLAYTKEEAFLNLKKYSYDLILLDYYLPDGDGLEILQSMAKLPYQIPIIMLTGCKDDELSKKVLQLGAQDYLVKDQLEAQTLIKSIEYSFERIVNLKALEDAKRQAISALRVKEDFMSIMTHELLTPLTGIINGVQLLRDDLSKGAVKNCQELCDIIEESGNSLHMTINNILDYLALDSIEMVLYTDSIEISSLIAYIKGRFEKSVNQKGLKFKIYAADDVPEILITDSSKLKQIIYNLISNAIKFTERGEIICRINFKNEEFLISIIDTGIGIDGDFLKKLFTIFTQADSSFTRKTGGSGLGLSLVQKLAHFLGGRVEVQSSVGVGSQFTLYLPKAPKK